MEFAFIGIVLFALVFISLIISVDFFIKGSPDRPPSIFLYLIFDNAVLSIVVFVATIPEKIECFTISTIHYYTYQWFCFSYYIH